MGSKNLEIVGTERPTDPDLERAAEAFRQAVKERMDLQQVEGQKKADVAAVLEKRILSGAIKIADGSHEEVVVHRYVDDDGTERAVKVTPGMKIKVHVAKE
jgi:hypothetical protein